MTKALIIGFGSIGRRHARILTELGCEVSVLTRHAITDYKYYSNLELALSEIVPDYIVIANETSEHLSMLECLISFKYEGMVLLEKPFSIQPMAVPTHHFRIAAVGYNLRFHPVLLALREALLEEEIISAQVYCGQYLPTWRPQRDYRLSYSAHSAQGGGVLHDLSHEIDYMAWLFGEWRYLTALGGKFSDLESDSDDCYGVMVAYERCSIATLQINYLDRVGRREIILNTKKHTYRADLRKSELERDGEVYSIPTQLDDTYRSQHVAILTGKTHQFCSFKEGIAVMHFLSASQTAMQTRKWVTA